MAGVVRERGIGVVTDDFSTAALIRVIESLTAEQVGGYKAASAAAARSLSAESQVIEWQRAVEAIVPPQR
jgi:hypothetical protein